MAKEDTAADIKAANGAELDPTDYTQKELDALLALAKDPAKAEEFKTQAEALKGKSTGTASGTSSASSSATQEEDMTNKIRVKVTDGKGTGSYVHPTSKTLLIRGGDAVAVPQDEWTDTMIRNKYLTEVRK